MGNKEDRLIGIWILAAVIILFLLYYWYLVYNGQRMDSLFVLSGWAIWVWIHIVMEIILLFTVTYGFYKRIYWARLYVIFLFLYSSCWALYFMFIERKMVYSRYAFFILYVIIIMYLMLSHVKEYFGKTSDIGLPSFAESQVYRYGDYTLFKKEKKLKRGGTQPFYFFSKKMSDKGEPCSKPDDFTVGINNITGIPYLIKKK